MSAWGIGSLTVRPSAQVDAAEGTPPAPQLATVDALVTWIPGEVIAAYAAIVLALQPEQGDAPEPPAVEITSGWWLVAAIVFAGVLTWLGAWSKVKKLPADAKKELRVRVALAAAAFAIWSFVIPGSAWYSIDGIADNQTLIPILAGIVGAVFALFAEGWVRRVGGAP